MPSKPTKFRRVQRVTNTADFDNNKGVVRVYVRLVDPANGKYIKGNVSRTITYRDAKVTDVADAIEGALDAE